MSNVSDEPSIYSSPNSDLHNSDDNSGIENFKRFSAWGVFGLGLITFGIYTAYWLYNRASTINVFHKNKIPEKLISIFLIVFIANFLFQIASTIFGDINAITAISLLISLVFYILFLVLLFNLRSRLAEITGIKPGPILTFFFNAIYLQYKINEAIDHM